MSFSFPEAWKRPAIGAAVLAACLLIGYAFGRWGKPARIEQHETVKTVTVVKEDTTAKEQLAALSTELETLKRSSHVVHTVVVTRDGTRTDQTVTDKQSVSVSQAQQSVMSVLELHDIKSVAQTQTVEVSKVVSTPRPKWFVGALVEFPAFKPSAGILVGHMFGPIGVAVTATVPTARPVQLPTFGAQLTLQF